MRKKSKKRVIARTEERIFVRALECMYSPFIEYLTYKLHDENKWIRCIAADALGNTGDVRGVDELVAALQDRDVEVRIAASRSLWHIGRMGNPRALAALISS